MSQELLYTSAPTGLKSGSRGFATVLCTAGMASNISTRLETLSGYRHVFSPQDPQASHNPVSWSHLRLTINGQPTSILSRIAAYGVDYSGRTNKLAHHVVPTPAELAKAGPAWMLLQSSWVRSDWDGSCQTPASGPALPSGNQPVEVCQRWEQTTGDAGWGGVVAESIASSASKPLWIVFSIDQLASLLGLINESIALLPVSQRWRATFSTYYTNLPPEIDCKVRCVLVGTEEAKLAPARGTVIDLTKTLAPAAASAYVETARTGVVMASAIAPMPASLSGHSGSRASSPLEVIDGDSLWPEEILLQPPAVLGKPPGLAMANKPSLPPQLPKAAMAADRKDGGSKRFLWTTAVSGLAIILLLSAAIPVILATKKRADGITELAANGTSEEQSRQPAHTVQPERKINFGEDKPGSTITTSDSDPTNSTTSGAISTQDVNPPFPGPQSKDKTSAIDPEQKPTDPTKNIASPPNEEKITNSAEAKPLSDNASDPPVFSAPPTDSKNEDTIGAQSILPIADANPVPDVKMRSITETEELQNGNNNDKSLTIPIVTITANLNAKLFFKDKVMRFDFSQKHRVAGVTGFFYSKTDDIENLSSREKATYSEKAEFTDQFVKTIYNLKSNGNSNTISGEIYFLKGKENSETKDVLRLGDELLGAHGKILAAQEHFNSSINVPSVANFDMSKDFEMPLLFFNKVDAEVNLKLDTISAFLGRDNLKESEKSLANANTKILHEIVENIKQGRDSIEKINQLQLPIGYLVFKTLKSGQASILTSSQNASYQIISITFKLQIPE